MPDCEEFTYNGTNGEDGSYQEYTVPGGFSIIEVEAWGAEGCTVGFAAASGNGGYIKARVPVTAGETLRVFVGGRPSTKRDGGFNGGGAGGSSTTSGAGGGGASDVRRSPYGLADRLVVAGAGGGGSGTSSGDSGTLASAGGDGGYPEGLQGAAVGSSGEGGFGGTQSAGGAGSPSGGSAGSLGQGGAGLGGGVTLGGGGGGGGLYGGGGGGQGTTRGGGGGGSSGVASGVTLVDHATGTRTGHGLVSICPRTSGWIPGGRVLSVSR